MDMCSDAQDLWNFTYVQAVDNVKKLTFVNRDEMALVDVPHEDVKLKCYSGEPQLEKIMENGNLKKILSFF